MQSDSKGVDLARPRYLARYRRFFTAKIVGGACSALGAVIIQAMWYAISHL